MPEEKIKIKDLAGELDVQSKDMLRALRDLGLPAKTTAGSVSVEDAARLRENAADYAREMDELQAYGEQQLSSLSCRQLVTFHDGFSYFADAFGLEIAAAMEVEAGSEPSARELEEVVAVVRENAIPAVFSEANGTQDAAQLVARETGAGVFVLDMGLSNPDAIRNNIDTVKEALQ